MLNPLSKDNQFTQGLLGGDAARRSLGRNRVGGFLRAPTALPKSKPKRKRIPYRNAFDRSENVAREAERVKNLTEPDPSSALPKRKRLQTWRDYKTPKPKRKDTVKKTILSRLDSNKEF